MHEYRYDRLPTPAARRSARESLAEQIGKYLAAGGTVQAVAGFSATVPAKAHRDLERIVCPRKQPRLRNRVTATDRKAMARRNKQEARRPW